MNEELETHVGMRQAISARAAVPRARSILLNERTVSFNNQSVGCGFYFLAEHSYPPKGPDEKSTRFTEYSCYQRQPELFSLIVS